VIEHATRRIRILGVTLRKRRHQELRRGQKLVGPLRGEELLLATAQRIEAAMA
jgi:hypothetical protein